jgi:hypothetical protein
MSKEIIKNELLEIDITRSWPLNRLKSVRVKRTAATYGDSVTLTAEEVELLYCALVTLFNDAYSAKEQMVTS